MKRTLYVYVCSINSQYDSLLLLIIYCVKIYAYHTSRKAISIIRIYFSCYRLQMFASGT